MVGKLTTYLRRSGHVVSSWPRYMGRIRPARTTQAPIPGDQGMTWRLRPLRQNPESSAGRAIGILCSPALLSKGVKIVYELRKEFVEASKQSQSKKLTEQRPAERRFAPSHEAGR
jgi:hypothetical protein